MLIKVGESLIAILVKMILIAHPSWDIGLYSCKLDLYGWAWDVLIQMFSPN